MQEQFTIAPFDLSQLKNWIFAVQYSIISWFGKRHFTNSFDVSKVLGLTVANSLICLFMAREIILWFLYFMNRGIYGKSSVPLRLRNEI